MAPEDALSGLVEHLAEAEQILSGGSGGSSISQGVSNSAPASEERDSVVEAAAVMDDLERSSSVGTRSETGSDGSRPHPQESGPVADDASERVAGLRVDEGDHVRQPGLHSLSVLQRLRNSEAAKSEVDVELHNMEAAMAAMTNMTRLRLRMMDKQGLRPVEVADLNMLLDTDNFQMEEMSEHGEAATGPDPSSLQLLAKPSGGVRKVAPPQLQKAGDRSTLDAIAEDGSDDTAGSAYSGSGFNVSSDGDGLGGGVGSGGLQDFEDHRVLDLVMMENERAMEVIRGMEELAAQATLRESECEARVERLMEQVEASHRSHALTREELDATKELVGEKDEGRAPVLQGLSRLLGATAGQDPRAPAGPASPSLQQSAAGTEELKEQLSALRESNRIAEARVEALKRALASEEARHRRERDDLTRRLQSCTADADDDAKVTEIRQLRDSLKSVQEERNTLVNTFEWREVQWKTQIENLQLELEEAKRRHESESRGLQPDISAQEEGAAEKAVDADALYVPQGVSAADQNTSIFGWLRCPIRSARGTEGLKPVFCQEACWKMISAMSGVLAFWCCAHDYTMLRTTREANRMWGNGLLEGKTIFSLTSGASSQAWLKKAFHSHQRIAEMKQAGRGLSGFVVRDLGCESFCSKTGDTFDACVIAARFPAEPACGREPGFFVVLEMQQPSRPRGGAEPPCSRGESLQRRGMGRPSSEASSASSVSPSDSASNVHRRYCAS